MVEYTHTKEREISKCWRLSFSNAKRVIEKKTSQQPREEEEKKKKKKALSKSESVSFFAQESRRVFREACARGDDVNDVNDDEEEEEASEREKLVAPQRVSSLFELREDDALCCFG